ncbi:MAG: hypothetical protein M3N14_01980 [Bacteroidota bacterium]|nr:hypothetical protein [Bacteroidota bacterium]
MREIHLIHVIHVIHLIHLIHVIQQIHVIQARTPPEHPSTCQIYGRQPMPATFNAQPATNFHNN